MFIKDGKRFNIYASSTIDDIQYENFTKAEDRAVAGITEIQEPAAPEDYTDYTYTKQEFDEEPYVTYTPMTEEEIEALHETRAQEVWERIKELRQHKISSNGVLVVIDGNDYWFHTDGTSLIQQLGLNVKALGMLMQATPMNTVIPGITPWKTMTGAFVQLKLQDAIAILTAGAAMQGALFQAAEAHKAALWLTPDPRTYDYISTGWPDGFPELVGT
jgi:hypothetical protein